MTLTRRTQKEVDSGVAYKYNIQKETIMANTLNRQQQLIVASAKMALAHYGDLVDTETGEQMSSQDKQDIINSNELSWIQRVEEAVGNEH